MCRTLSCPYSIDQVGGDGHEVFTATLLNLFGELLSRRAGEERRVDTNHLATCRLGGRPFLPGRHILDALLQQLPVVVQLLGSLVEIPAVRRKDSLIEGDNRAASRAAEAADKLPPAVTWGNVLGRMCVFGGDDYIAEATRSAIMNSSPRASCVSHQQRQFHTIEINLVFHHQLAQCLEASASIDRLHFFGGGGLTAAVAILVASR